MRFSIIIPTYNRADLLKECVTALFHQKFSKDLYEIIVVNDGSTDETKEIIASLKKQSPVAFESFHQANQGQAVARNYGIRHAKGEIILFLGDDIIATSQLLHEHDRLHTTDTSESAAVLGFVTWHPRLTITPLMKFMERGGAILGRFGGHQFAYDLLKGKEKANWRFFYTANISLKRSLLEKFKFDPWFSGYGWEDIELGYRLTKKAGLILYYAPHAVAYHDHPTNFEQWAARMRQIGSSIHRIHERYPELSLLPSAKKRVVFTLLSNPLVLKLICFLWYDLYLYALSKKYFLEGFTTGYTNHHDKKKI